MGEPRIMVAVDPDALNALREELADLPKADRTPARIAEIIGNDSWSVVECDQCDKRVPVAVTVVQPPDYETRTVTICEPCLRRALALLEVSA